jgi:hypothetical protein
MRVPWRSGFPDVLVHAPWSGADGVGKHSKHRAAKRERDMAAAGQVIGTFIKPDLIDALYDIYEALDLERPPLLVAPALTEANRKNALPIAFAEAISSVTGWKTAKLIFQARSSNRDLTKDGWYRLTHEPGFYGEVEQGRHYVLVDDVMTMGGTLASLRGFIENQSGAVIAMTALAGERNGNFPISLAQSTLGRLTGHLGGSLDGLVRKECGHGIDCLTEQEGEFLLRCPTAVEFGKEVARARNP